MVGAKKTAIAVNLLPRPTYISTSSEMLRPLAPASGLPIPPNSAQPPEAGAAETTIAISPAVLNGAVDPVASAAVPAVSSALAVDVKPPASSSTPGRRQFTWDDEAVLVELWKKYITEYFNGVRKRVLEKMTDELNSKFSSPPHFTVKQVNNKLHYMERRYRSLLDEFRSSGTPISVTDASVSVRASVERKFSLFYVVHDVLREVVDVPHPLTPIAPMNLTGSTMQNRSGAPAAGVTDVVSLMHDGIGVGEDDGLPASSASNDPMSIGISEADLPDGVQAPEVPSLAPKRSLPGTGNGSGENGGSSPKRARTNTGPGTPIEPIAARVTGMVNRVVAISERILIADRNERSERMEKSKRAAEVRLKEIALMERYAALREREERNSEKKVKIEALKFIVSNLNDAGAAEEEASAMKRRTLKQLEELINEIGDEVLGVNEGNEEVNMNSNDNNDNNDPNNDTENNDIDVSRR